MCTGYDKKFSRLYQFYVKRSILLVHLWGGFVRRVVPNIIFLQKWFVWTSYLELTKRLQASYLPQCQFPHSTSLMYVEIYPRESILSTSCQLISSPKQTKFWNPACSTPLLMWWVVGPIQINRCGWVCVRVGGPLSKLKTSVVNPGNYLQWLTISDK